MLDADGAFIANQLQCADDVPPGFRAVAVADRPENPGTVQFMRVRLRVEDAVLRSVSAVDGGVFGVHMEQGPCLAECFDAGNGIHALPKQMAWIKIDTNLVAACLAQTQTSLGVIDDEVRMLLRSLPSRRASPGNRFVYSSMESRVLATATPTHAYSLPARDRSPTPGGVNLPIPQGSRKR